MTPREAAVEIFQAGLRAVDPRAAVGGHLGHVRAVCASRGCRELVAVAFGKAAVPMMAAVAEGCGDLLTRAVAVTKDGHAGIARLPETVEVFEAGHPLPDERGVAATRRIVEVLAGARERTLVLCLVSGGGSALLVSPAEGITLEEKQVTTDLLLRAGADIAELNAVRKHLSSVKGGRLAFVAHPAPVVSLLLSDVIGDSFSVIASGPTAPDDSTFAHAWGVLEKYGLTAAVPAPVRARLEDGVRGRVPETPREGAAAFAAVENRIVASNALAAAAAVRRAEELGCRTELLGCDLHGEAREVAKRLAGKAVAWAETAASGGRRCLVAGGETTVTVRGSGRGGRNTEMALAFALEIEARSGVTMLSAGTDGTDGPTDAAGAVVDGDTVPRARAAGLDPDGALADNDSYSFFRDAGGLVVTGPTGTNVMDLQVILVE